MRLHDLVQIFAVECAKMEEGIAKWHAHLLEGYLPRVKDDEVVRLWWNVCKDDGDDYLSENVCRHLVSSGNLKEVEWLLASGEWSKLRFEVGGLSAWIGDFWVRLEGKKKDGDSERETGIERGLELVRDAVIESWGVVQENPWELGFQVLGRLIDCENTVVRRYLRSIEKLECKPWLKPMQRCWDRSGEGIISGEFHFDAPVWDIFLHKKSFTAAVGFGAQVAMLDLKEMRVTVRCAGHTGWVNKVVISGDGKLVFSWSSDGTVRQWDIESGDEHKDKRIQLDDEESSEDSDVGEAIECAAFSTEESFVVTGSKRGKIKVWNLSNGERVGRTMDASEKVECIALSPNGRTVAAGLGTGSLLLYNVQTSRSVFGELKGIVPTRITSIAFAAGGLLMASCVYDCAVRLWDVEGKTQLGDPYFFCRGLPVSVRFTEDNMHIFSDYTGGFVNVWDLVSGAQIRLLRAHPFEVSCVAITGELGSRLAVSGSRDGTVGVWDMQVRPNAGKERVYHKGRILCITASPNGAIFVSGSEDKTLRIWDGDDGRPLGELLCGDENDVALVTVSPDGQQIVSVSDDSTLRVWDVRRHAQVGDALRRPEDRINCITYSPNGEFVVAGSDDQTVRVWRIIGDCENGEGAGETADKRVRLAGHGAAEGMSSRQALRLEKTLRHDAAVTSVAVSRDGQRVLSGLKNGEIWVWDLKSGSCIDRKQSDNDNPIERINISETNEVVTTKFREELEWWLDNESGLIRILHSEDKTGITLAEGQEGSVTRELSEVVCSVRIVRLKPSDKKIATLPARVHPRAWAYHTRRRVLCVGLEDGRVLFFRVEI